MAGQRIWERANSDNGIINTGNLPNGIYLVSVELKNGERKVYRMVKNK
jgi:hypothetical protein